MVSFLKRHPFWVASAIAAVVEVLALYQQWPPPPVKICASIELGGLLANAAKAEAELHDLRMQMRKGPGEDTVKDVMRMEAAAAAAANDIALYKQREAARQKAAGNTAGGNTCS